MGVEEEAHVTPETLDFRAVARVATRVRLTDVRLAYSQVGRFVDLADLEPDWPDRAFVGFDSHPADDFESSDATEFSVLCRFVCHFFSGVDSSETEEPPEADAENPPAVAIEALFELSYELDQREGIEPLDLEHFAFANGTHNAWPYWREFAQTMSQRLGIPPYIAGPFKLPSPDDPDQDASSEDAMSEPGGS